MKALIDTCVLVDFLQKRTPFDTDARDVMMLIAGNFVEGYTTAKAVTDIYYLAHRMTHSSEETRKIIANLLTIIDIMDTKSVDARLALSSPVGDYEDAVMAETAKRKKADCIVTRNIKDYANAGIPVFTPSDFIRKIRESLE